ncbi:hypothetical protein CNMCM7691_001349 [Aspergillus felis]|uniref:BTB domain transcription factor n=1 Tax=Aspergillus felis TaxID=1287682 RepID=A0A8H6QZD4_9EURO|nr:hypothetical protein CNMCM7691_001349 [Aspergillus felis]
MPANEQRSPESHEEFSRSSSTTKPSNSAASEDVYVEDISSRDSGYDGDIEVVKPYAIEEPEDEASRVVPRLAISPASNDAESWQGELVDSMQDLHCDSDHPDLRCRPSHKRGRKRKTPTFAAGNSAPGRRQVYAPAPDIQSAQLARFTIASKHNLTMATRTSSRQAAQKAKEAITSTSEIKPKKTAGAKRKETAEKGPEPKRGKKVDREPDHEKEKKEQEQQKREEKDRPELKEQVKEEAVPGPGEKDEKEEQGKAIRQLSEQPEERAEKPEQEPKEGAKEEAAPEPREGEKESEEKGAKEPEEKAAEAPAKEGVEAGIRKSQEREDIVPSNILEKGIIYFFFRPRVNVEDPHSVKDVARSFFVLRPTPLGAVLDANQGTVAADARCRLMILPKKKFPTSGRERDMGFVEKAGISMKELHDSFMVGEKYETSTRGERAVQEARPYAEGVYAITSGKRASHLAYILTIPQELGSIQEDFGLHSQGSWILQSKNPKYPGPSFAQLPKDPEYPESVRQKFGDYRWVPLEPEFIDYPNAQFLMIGEATDDLGKAATAEPGKKEAHEEQPGEELEKLEQENEERIESLKGDETVYEDLGLDAKKYPKVPTTWNE